MTLIEATTQRKRSVGRHDAGTESVRVDGAGAGWNSRGAIEVFMPNALETIGRLFFSFLWDRCGSP
jgi:hypothetical protein